MQITQLLFAMGMALTATAAPIPSFTGFPEHSKIIQVAAEDMPQPYLDTRVSGYATAAPTHAQEGPDNFNLILGAAKVMPMPQPIPDPRNPLVKRGDATAAPAPQQYQTGPKEFKVIFPTEPIDFGYEPSRPQKRGAADLVITNKWACPDDAKTPLGNGVEALFRNTFGIPPECGWPGEPFP